MSKSPGTSLIRLRGVRHHNLKGFDLDLPLRRLIVVTGLSGSGKSSLAFDTLYAEGQRRYVETFSPYARQFFERMDRPQVDRVDGMPPAIAIEQRNSVRTTRSTVGTMTEICDYLKVLWPQVAQLHCRQCGQPVRQDSPRDIWQTLTAEGAAPDADHLVTFDVALSAKLSLSESLALVARQGYQRLLVDGELLRVDEAAARSSIRVPRAALTVVQDRLRLTPRNRARFVEACEQAYHFGKGKLAVREVATRPSDPGLKTQDARLFSNRLHCAQCDIEYREPSPALFSFNHPLGACPACKGFGRIITIDYDLAIPDRSLTLDQGAVKPWRSGFSAECQDDLRQFCKKRGVPIHVRFDELSPEHQRWVLEGDPGYGRDDAHRWPRAWYGVQGYFKWLESKAYKMHVRVLLSRYRAYTPCPACHGARLQPDALLYRLRLHDSASSGPGEDETHWTLCATSRNPPPNAGPPVQPEVRDPEEGNPESALTLAGFYALPIRDALRVVDRISRRFAETRGSRSSALEIVLAEARARLAYLNHVGLGYLTLNRPTRTLSGGETERVNLTACLGTRLVNTLFVLDEPSVGLHPRDTDRLVHLLQQLRDAGNTVVVVEHEAGVMRAADQIVDLGPGHGATGGEVVFQGTFAGILKCGGSLTGQYLSGRKRIELPRRRPVGRDFRPSPASKGGCSGDRQAGGPALRIVNATLHNLQGLTVEIPLNRFVCITGVSGSGKSTLLGEVLWPALSTCLKSGVARPRPAPAAVSKRIEPPPRQRAPAANAEKADEASPARNPRPAMLTGQEHLAEAVFVDQSLLGRTPRSNPAVYIGAFDDIRELFAQSEPAKRRGLNASAFSFNSGQGQCERCRGAGFEKIEMQFLSDVFIRCPDCGGRRYRQHILDVRVSGVPGEPPAQHPAASGRTRGAPPQAAGWSIADVLDAAVDEAIEFLSSFPDSKPAQRAVASLRLLQEAGLGYVRLGQPINTLSGGESQRLKLVRHLVETVAADASRRPGRPGAGPGERVDPHPHPRDARPTLFLFDEPTTGLHFDDVRVLLKVFQRLVDSGHSVVVIEHNLEVIKCADWVIDLGPDAGDEGGRIVAKGTPEEIAACEASHTGRFLRTLGLAGGPPPETSRRVSRVVHRSGDGLPSRSATITIRGAREHNLQSLALDIPRDRFVVITGVSGSGKSTLAFDLLFAEGQRRFLDSMNLYARQFVDQLPRPDVDLITGLPPTVSIEQRVSRGGGKSTVATVTEVFHFLRLLFARLGTQYCPDCQLPVTPQTRDEVRRRIQAEVRQRGELRLLAPVVKGRRGFHTDVAEWAAKHGYAEVRADGKMHPTRERLRLDRFREHNVEIVVGALNRNAVVSRHNANLPRQGNPSGPAEAQLQEIVDGALRLGDGTLFALDRHGRITVHSTERTCPKCGRSFTPPAPKDFSYNSPAGWCPKCRGFGELFYMPADVDRGAREDAIAESWFEWMEGQREICPECHGARLNPVARAVRLSVPGRHRPVADREPGGLTIETFSQMPVAAAARLFRQVRFSGRAAVIARDILPEIRDRLKFLDEVGLGYLQLGRGVPTLSGGEAQRIRLAAQLGSNLSGALYLLDEPTIGLHVRDNERLLAALEKLKARGNSVVVVEHDEETMRHADYVVDLGPGAGIHGGQVVAAGTLAELARHPESVTGQWLRARRRYPTRGQRRPVQKPRTGSGRDCPAGASGRCGWLTLRNATAHNLKNLTVHFPLSRLVLVTGVSGSGKSTLLRECLLPALQSALKSRNPAGGPPKLTGHEALLAVHEVDQSPIGRTPRSVPATYVGFFDDIRSLFAQVPEARLRGYGPGRFSFNSPLGRCPQCQGAGAVKLEMNFLPPASVRCDGCGGTRFNRETLDIEYGGRNIAQVLDLSVEEALEFFAGIPRIKRALQALHDTGLDYLKLGQTSPTLSGGEAQRVKLVTHLLSGLKLAEPTGSLPGASARGRPARSTPPDEGADLFKTASPATLAATGAVARRNLFLLEEPTIGLHMADVRRLVDVLQRLVDAGHSVVIIEHNPDLIAEADWIIDLGPEGGEAGGRIVAQGTPEHIAGCPRSHTGRFLRKLLGTT